MTGLVARGMLESRQEVKAPEVPAQGEPRIPAETPDLIFQPPEEPSFRSSDVYAAQRCLSS